MNSKKPFLAVVALSVVWGCGGGGGGGGSNNGSSGTVAQGVTSLNAALADPSGTDFGSNVTSAQKTFKNAYGSSGQAKGQAALGYAIATSAGIYNDINAAFGVSNRASSRASVPFLAPFARLAPMTSLLGQIGGKDRISLSTILPGFTLPPSGSRARGVRPRAFPVSDPSYAEVKAAVVDASNKLNVALGYLSDANLQSLEASPLVVNYTVDGTAQSVKLGSVEGYGLKSAIETVRGFLDAALAYDYNYGTYDANAAFSAKFTTKLATDGATIAPADYLPGGTFGQRSSDGQARLSDLKTMWTGVASDGKKAIAAYQARVPSASGTAQWATELAPAISDASLSTANADLTTFSDVLNGTSIPTTLTDTQGNKTTISINLENFLDHAPASLTALFPTLTVHYTSGNDFATLTSTPGSIADTTFGGLIPSGVPTSFLYDQDRTIYVYQGEGLPSQGVVALQAFAFFAPYGLPY